jgi:hypothetical protein
MKQNGVSEVTSRESKRDNAIERIYNLKNINNKAIITNTINIITTIITTTTTTTTTTAAATTTITTTTNININNNNNNNNNNTELDQLA